MSHTHANGEEHFGSHGPPGPGTMPPPGAPGGPPPQMMAPPAPDPVMQAVIDASFNPVDLAVNEEGLVLCAPHTREKCDECGLDFTSQNRIARVLIANPNLLCPPPAKVVNPQISQIVTSQKEEGNTLYKAGNHPGAIQKYSIAASIAVQRPAWELQQIMREELSAVLSNRSAANFEAGDYIGALVDAEQVIQLRRNWSKGHFRKAKALLGLGRHQEAIDALDLGLAFEPDNTEMSTFRSEIAAKMSGADVGTVVVGKKA